MLSDDTKISQLPPEVIATPSKKQASLLKSQKRKRQPQQTASGENPSKKARQDLSEETSQPPLLFSSKKPSSAKLTEAKGLTPFIKQAQFLQRLKNIIGNGPTYEVAQTAKLLAQQSYTNLTTRSSKISYGRALTLYNKVIDHQDAKAAYQLAMLYLEGNGDLPKDSQQNLAWLTVAAGFGHAQAQFDLGQFYETTSSNFHGTDAQQQHLMMALQWYEAAAAQSYEAAIEPYQKLSLVMAEIMEQGAQEAEAIAQSARTRRCTRSKK